MYSFLKKSYDTSYNTIARNSYGVTLRTRYMTGVKICPAYDVFLYETKKITILHPSTLIVHTPLILNLFTPVRDCKTGFNNLGTQIGYI